jgi:predicted kinase
VFNVDANTCIERNKAREGLRNVPETVIRNMCRDFRVPTKDEDERVIDIIEVGE